jgi:hypothetical protein
VRSWWGRSTGLLSVCHERRVKILFVTIGEMKEKKRPFDIILQERVSNHLKRL